MAQRYFYTKHYHIWNIWKVMNKAFKLKTIEDFNSVDVFDTITLTYEDRYGVEY